MTTTITPDERAAMRRLADAATEGPWEVDGSEVSQHWSRPEPWLTVASNEVACMSYCYGGSARGIERDEDAAFIAAARTAVPRLLDALDTVEAEVARLREERCSHLKCPGGSLCCCYPSAPDVARPALMSDDSDALALLDEMNHEGRIEYADYSALHDAITAARPAPVWDEDAVTEAVASALADHRPDLDETAVFTGECDCGWRTPGPAWAASEEEHRPHVASAVLAVVREHLPVRPDRETIADVDCEALRRFVDSFCDDEAGEVEHVVSADGTSGFALTGGNDAHAVLRKAASALWPGESRATVQAEALHDAAEEIDRLYFGPDQDKPFSTGARHKWGAMRAAGRVRARANRLAPKEG